MNKETKRLVFDFEDQKKAVAEFENEAYTIKGHFGFVKYEYKQTGKKKSVLYEATQIEFKFPSDHTIDGERADMELIFHLKSDTIFEVSLLSFLFKSCE